MPRTIFLAAALLAGAALGRSARAEAPQIQPAPVPGAEKDQKWVEGFCKDEANRDTKTCRDRAAALAAAAPAEPDCGELFEKFAQETYKGKRLSRARACAKEGVRWRSKACRETRKGFERYAAAAQAKCEAPAGGVEVAGFITGGGTKGTQGSGGGAKASKSAFTGGKGAGKKGK